MQAALATRAAALPARLGTGRSARIRAVSCRAQRSTSSPLPEHTPSAAFALSTLLLTHPALAEEEPVAAAANAAAEASTSVGITVAGWALVLSPIVFYGLFTIYRTQFDPKAKFGDALFAYVALIILANVLSITLLKTRIY